MYAEHMSASKAMYRDPAQTAQARYGADLMVRAFETTGEFGKNEAKIKSVYGQFLAAGGGAEVFKGSWQKSGTALDADRLKSLLSGTGEGGARGRTEVLDFFKNKDTMEYARALESQNLEGAQAVEIKNGSLLAEMIGAATANAMKHKDAAGGKPGGTATGKGLNK
jgi:hypothetical protein